MNRCVREEKKKVHKKASYWDTPSVSMTEIEKENEKENEME